MADVISLADVALAKLCAEKQVQPSEALTLGFRLGFVAGKTHTTVELLAENFELTNAPG